MSAPSNANESNKISRLILTINTELEAKRKVVVHCNAGLGRSGMIVGLLLKKMALIKKPIEHVRKYRPGSIETLEQEIFIRNFRDSEKNSQHSQMVPSPWLTCMRERSMP